MPEAKPPPEQKRDGREERKPKSFSLQKAIKPRSDAGSGSQGWLEVRGALLITGLSYKTLEWKVLALGVGWDGKVFTEAIHGTAYAGGESRLG